MFRSLLKVARSNRASIMNANLNVSFPIYTSPLKFMATSAQKKKKQQGSNIPKSNPSASTSSNGSSHLKHSTAINLNDPFSIPDELMKSYLTGPFALNDNGEHCIHRAVIEKDSVALEAHINALHAHVNAISETMLANPAITHELKHILHAADSKPGSPSVAYRYVISLRTKDKLCSIMLCIPSNSTNLMQLLLQNGAYANGSYDIGLPTPITALIGCLNMSMCDSAMLLMDHGADMNQIVGKNTPLSIAVYNDLLSVVKYLSKNGVDLANADKAAGYAVITEAVYLGKTAIVKCLLDMYCARVDPNYVTFIEQHPELDNYDNVPEPVVSISADGIPPVMKSQIAAITQEDPNAPKGVLQAEVPAEGLGPGQTKLAQDLLESLSPEERDNLWHMVEVTKREHIPDITHLVDLNGLVMLASQRKDEETMRLLGFYGGLFECE